MPTVLDTHIATRNAERFAALGEAGYAHYVVDVLQDRADRYAAHVAAMDLPPELVQWSLAMRNRFATSYLRCSHFVADWITALLILRYGEEPRAYDAAEVAAAVADGRAPACSTDPNFAGWPLAFSDDDVRRAAELLTFKKWPEFFTPMVVEA